MNTHDKTSQTASASCAASCNCADKASGCNSKDSCCNGKDSSCKNCSKCGSQLKSGMKYENVCTSCEPVYLNRCSGCQHLLWDCMCIKPHTWE